jgi:tellurite resistance protein
LEQPTDAHWVLKAMIAVAGADGRLNAHEVRMIQQVYEDETGRSVEVSGIFLAVQAYATRRDVLAELSGVAGSMSAATKERIIRAAYLTLLADHRIAGPESKTLKDIAAALGVSDDQFQAIVDEAERNRGKGEA